MGWLGWSEDQALAADVNAIAAGYAGKLDMLKAVFGSSEETPADPQVQTRPMTEELFDTLFK